MHFSWSQWSVAIPVALAVLFLLWVLWNLWQEGR